MSNEFDEQETDDFPETWEDVEEIRSATIRKGREEAAADLRKYKLALFAAIRNGTIMPSGLKFGKSMDEINRMSVDTVTEVMKSIDFDKMEAEYKQGGGR